MASAVVVYEHTKSRAQLFAGEIFAFVLFADDADGWAKKRNQPLKFCLGLVGDDAGHMSYRTELDVAL